MITLPIKTLIDRVIEVQKMFPQVNLDHVIDELYAIRKEVDEWRSQAIIVGFKDEYDHIAKSILGRPFSDSEWEFGVKDCVENDSSLLQSTGDVITEYADGYAHEIKLESEEE
jgi:hypothetical protein